jgi:hypothetical protein
MPNWGSAHNYCPFQGRTNQGMPWNSFNLSYPHIDKHRGRRLSLSRPPHGGITRLTDSGSSAASLYTKTNRSGRGGGTEQSRRNCCEHRKADPRAPPQDHERDLGSSSLVAAPEVDAPGFHQRLLHLNKRTV